MLQVIQVSFLEMVNYNGLKVLWAFYRCVVRFYIIHRIYSAVIRSLLRYGVLFDSLNYTNFEYFVYWIFQCQVIFGFQGIQHGKVLREIGNIILIKKTDYCQN